MIAKICQVFFQSVRKLKSYWESRIKVTWKWDNCGDFPTLWKRRHLLSMIDLWECTAVLSACWFLHSSKLQLPTTALLLRFVIGLRLQEGNKMLHWFSYSAPPPPLPSSQAQCRFKESHDSALLSLKATEFQLLATQPRSDWWSSSRPYWVRLVVF